MAKKYLHGDFSKGSREDPDIDQPLLEAGEEIDEEKQNYNDDEKLFTPSSSTLNIPSGSSSKSSSLTKDKRAEIIAKYKKVIPDKTSRKKSGDDDKSETRGKAANLLAVSQEFQQFNEQISINKIREGVDQFASKATIILQLQYIEETQCIVGNIRSVEGLDFDAKHIPKDIQFHLKLLPGGKFRMKTPWRPTSDRALALTFTIGPVATQQMLKCRLCMRLYGRSSSKRYSGSRCYGESHITLDELLKRPNQMLDFRRYVIPKGKSSMGEESRFTTDSEAENFR